MANWEKKSNNEIFLELKRIQEKHENLKNELIEKYDELERLERDFHDANEVINRRMKGVNNNG